MLLLGCIVGAAQAVDLTPAQQQLLQQTLPQLTPDQQAKAQVLLQQNQNNATTQSVPQFPKTVLPRNVPSAGQQSQQTQPQQPLQQFGYDLFAGVPTTFAPATDIPVPADYVIGPGDTVQIQLFGKENTQYTLPVTRDGTLHFPKIGAISVAGLSFPELKRNLQRRVEHQLIGVKANISMGPLRSIRIFVLGDVQQSGSYTVSGLSTMTNALFVSGGIKPIGSLRDIQLKRQGKIVSHLDLYDLLLHGDTRGDARLQPGDVIFVPPIGKTVGIAGEVRRPAIYELKDEKTIGDALAFAGGLLPTAYPQGAKLERIDEQRGRTVLDVDLTQSGTLAEPVHNGDIVHVYPVLSTMDDVVKLDGHVQRPGTYQWHEGMRLTDLIPTTDDLQDKPDLDYVLIERQLPPDEHLQVFSTSLRTAWAQPQSKANIELQPRDKVVVFSFAKDRGDAINLLMADLMQQASKDQPLQVVTVDGRIRFPGQYPMEQGMHISDLLRAGGELSEAAYTLQAELTRYEIVNGDYRETLHQDIDLQKVLAGDASADALLQPHDRLTIKELPQWSEQESVKITGEVRFPGTYPIRRGETLSMLLKRAGGVTKFANPDAAVFMRAELRAREQEQLNLMRQQMQEELASLALEQTQVDTKKTESVATLRNLSTQFEKVKATGRLVIDLPAIIAGNEDADVVLKDRDSLVVPSATQEVTVIGEVFHPTSLLYQSDLDRDDYINQSGGLTNKADDKRIYVVRANGSVLANSGSSWFSKNQTDIKPGDTIVVPMDLERLRPLTLWTSVSKIFYQFGLAIAAWHTIGVLN
jgi:polysaccharide export outer membrane protein